MVYILFSLFFFSPVFSQSGGPFNLPEDCFPGMSQGLRSNQIMIELGFKEIKDRGDFKKITKQESEIWGKYSDAFDDQKFSRLQDENKLFWQKASSVDCTDFEAMTKLFNEYDFLSQKIINTYNKNSEQLRMIEPDLEKLFIEKSFNNRCDTRIGFGQNDSMYGYKPFQQIGGTCYAAGASALIYAAQKEKVQPSHLDLALNWVINNSKKGMENDPLKSMEGGFTCSTIEAAMNGYCPAELVGDEFKGKTEYSSVAKKIYEVDYLSLAFDDEKDQKRSRNDFKENFDFHVGCFYNDKTEYDRLSRDVWKIIKKWDNKFNYKFELVEEISKKIIEPKCRSKDKIKHKILCEDFKPDSTFSKSKYDKMADLLIDKLKQGLPVGLSIRSSALYESNANHQVTLLGFEINQDTHKCEAIILDSNDPSLGQYQPWIKKTSTPQVIRAPITNIIGQIYQFQLVKSED